MSCAEVKLVTVRVARPKHRKTTEEAGLGLRAQGPGPGQGWGRGEASGEEQQGEKGNWGRQAGSGVIRVRRPLGQGVLGVRGSQTTCLALPLPVPFPSPPLGFSVVVNIN